MPERPVQSNSPSSPTSCAPSANNLLAFYRVVGQLKTTKRTGWVYSGVTLPESVSDHMYRMSLIALSLPYPPPRREHLMKLALVHDLAEAEVGDIAPADNVAPADKHAREEAAMRRIRDEVLEGSKLGEELYVLWREYEDGVTEDARLVKEIDKLEMVIQADEYERAQGKELGDFFRTTRGAFTNPAIVEIDEVLRAEREERLADGEGGVR